MTYDQIKKRVGKNIKYYDDTNGWLTDRDVTETDIADFVNEIYTEEMFPLFASRWPHMFRQIGLLDNWVMSCTVNSSSTGTTLVIDNDTVSEFANSMEGLYVYNATDDETTKIVTFTSVSTVTVEDTIGDTWDGDTIYVLGEEFAFGSDASDIYTIESVGIKYSSDDTYFTKAQFRDKTDLFSVGNETGSKLTPFVYLTTVTESNLLYDAIGVFPKFDEKVSHAIEVNYVAKPQALSTATAVPAIPIQESLVAGATMRAYEKMQDFQSASYWQAKYERASKKEISRFRPNTTNIPINIRLNKNVYNIHKRLI